MRPRVTPGQGGPLEEASPGGPVLVGGIGLPWLSDLEVAMQFLREVEGLEWSEDVVVDDLTMPAHHVLHRLLEVEPSRVVLVVSKLSEVDAPGATRRYALDLTPPPNDEVHQRLVESVALEIVDVDHILAVLRYWKALPTDTVVIEVEPGHRPVDEVLAVLHEEVA